MSEQLLQLILDELKNIKADQQITIEKLANLEQAINDIPQVKQAVLETNQDVKQILENQKSINEILGEHEVSIRTLRRKPV